jgi:Carboxypeptidase regulatory-like domain
VSWIRELRAWCGGGQRTDSPVNSQEIDEELMFHLRLLIDDNLARGMPPDNAWQEAQRRFGSLRRYAEACRNSARGGIVSWLAPAAALFLAGVFCGSWLLMTGQQHPPTVAPHDLTGRVVDRRGNPLADATLLVILKTWPGGRYQQEPFTATSNSAGQFRLPELIPAEGQFAVQVAAVRSGYALASSYRLLPGPGPHSFEPVTLALGEASPVTLVVQDSSGRSVARARVVPASRRSPDGERHLVYLQGSEPIQAVADAAGRVSLDCFALGDQAEVFIQLPGKEWEPHEIRIPKNAMTITVSAQSTADEDEEPVSPTAESSS